MDWTKQQIAGLMVLVITLSTGTNLFIEDRMSKTGCRNGWDYQSEGEFEGEFEGQYACYTQSEPRYQLCYDVYNSSNTENYWCTKGKQIILPEKSSYSQRKQSDGEAEACINAGCIIIS